MSEVVIKIDNLGKKYRIGSIGSGTLKGDLEALFNRMRRKNKHNNSGSYDLNEKLDHKGVEGEYIWALKNVCCEIKRGEAVGIIGRNGAGKSTLLKILSRITTPTCGEARIKGRVASLLEVGTGFHPELTGRENIFLNGTIMGMSRANIALKFDDIVEFSGLEKFVDTPVKRYSSGMAVRLAFAIAAHLEPEILLVDEVLAVGDFLFQKKCLGKMEERTSAGRTVIFVSHNMAAVNLLCSRGILIDQGTVLKVGPTSQVIAEYYSAFADHTIPKNGRVDLINHLGRHKKHFEGTVRLSYCLFKNKNNINSDYLNSGETNYITIGFEKVKEYLSPEIIFDIEIWDDKGAQIGFLSSEVMGKGTVVNCDKGEIQCTIPRLPLLPGQYILTLSCRVAGGGFSDAITDAVVLPVVGDNYFPSGWMPPNQRSGNILIEHIWE